MASTFADISIFDFLSQHLVLIALLVSAAWFYAGQQYLVKGNWGGFLWQAIAVLILIAFCINAVLAPTKSWLSLAIAIAAICIEIWLISKGLSRGIRRADGE